jgi:hypothetical protein
MTPTERLTGEVNRLGSQLADVTRKLSEADTRIVNAELKAEALEKLLRRARGMIDNGLDAHEFVIEVDAALVATGVDVSTLGEPLGSRFVSLDRPKPDILPDPRVTELQG